MAPSAAVVLCALLALFAAPGTVPHTPPAHSTLTSPAEPPQQQQPNIVVIMTDDQNRTEMRWMPKSRRLLGDHGVTFSSALSPAPNCCPARAGFLTGQYGQNNGVQHNTGPFGGFDSLNEPHNTLATWLQEAGYATALVGKYLNEFTGDDPPQVGWDRWNPAVSAIYDYVGTGFYDEGIVRTFEGNITKVVQRFTRTTVRELSATGEPFFVYASHVAPHGRFGGRTASGDIVWLPPLPTAAHADVLPDVVLPATRKPSYNATGPRPWPYPVATQTARATEPLQAEFTGRLRALQDVDDAVEDLVDVLEETGELDDTYIFLVSDNGHLFGEHRLVGKNVLFREALEVMLLVRVPAAVEGVISSAPVTLVDLTATITGLAAAAPSRLLDGRSFAPLLHGEPMAWRDTQLVQAGSSRTTQPLPGWDFRGVRTARYTYMRRAVDGAEFLYDRVRDPWETESVARQWRYGTILGLLRARYQALAECAGPGCDVRFGPLPAPRRPG